MNPTNVVVVSDAAALAQEAARRFVSLAEAEIAERGRFTVSLSGGSTPRALFQLLTQPPHVTSIDWDRVHVFWGDERTVPPDDPQSNYRMAREALLDHVPIPPTQVHRILAENEPADAARRYAETLAEVFELEPGEVPEFGLMLLGIGADGHTASLFPGTRALDETERLVVENVVPQLDTVRITLTVPVLTQARHTIVLAAGPDKAEAIQRAIEGPYDPMQTPAQFVRKSVGEVIWLLDEAAAAKLQQKSA